MNVIDPSSNAALYGKGVFTTLTFANSKPVLWEKHKKRLERDTVSLGLCPPDGSSILATLMSEIGRSGLTRGRARITVHDNSLSPLWSEPAPTAPTIGVLVAPPRDLPDAFIIGISRYSVNSRSAIAGIKSCNYLENLTVIDEGKASGFNEMLRLNERGEITSAACANVFWIVGDAIFTPTLDTGCLAGTTREFILENYRVEEIRTDVNAITSADAILLTSAGIGARRATLGKVKMETSAFAEQIISRIRQEFGESETI